MRKITLAMALAAAVTAPASANEYVEELTNLAETELLGWLQDPEITKAVLEQNAKHAGLNQSDIDALDQAWRGEITSSSSPMIDEVMGRGVSRLLVSLQEDAGGVVTEVFIMDNHGLNVGQSSVTSDYWQGDEAKWQKTYQMGAGAMHFGEVEFDESTQTYQTQVSVSLVDPQNQTVIGAATFGIDVSALE